MRTPIDKPYNGGKWTRARYFEFLRSALRTASMKWSPIQECLKRAQTERKINPASGRLAMHFRCALCSRDFPRKGVQVDHIQPVGSLTSHADLPGFVQRMFCEVGGLRVACKGCHQGVTNHQTAVAIRNRVRKAPK